MTDASDDQGVTDGEVIDNVDRSRYELHTGDVIASTADYHRRDDVVVATYVRTEPDLRGQGMSDRLMKGVLTDIRDRGLRIEPVCWVAVAYVERFPDEAEGLLAS